MSGERTSARIQRNILAGVERRALDRLCAAAPGWVTPDKLTLLGLLGAVTVFAGYAASRVEPLFLLLSVLGYFLHWLGDSMDGSLARHRKIERPRYGYFVDHSIDAIGNFIIMAGLGVSLLVRMDVALFAISGYFLLSIYVFLKNQVLQTFELSFIGLGPTELRVLLSLITLGMLNTGRIGVTVRSEFFTVYDGLVLLAATVFVLLFTWSVTKTALILRREGS